MVLWEYTIISSIGEIQIQKSCELHRTHPWCHVWWLLHKYKYLWGVGGKGRCSNLQKGAIHTNTLKLRLE